MQHATNDSNKMDKQSDQKWTGKTQSEGTTGGIRSGISDLKSLVGDADVKALATDFSNKVRDFSGPLFQDSIGFVKRYPVSSAFGMAAIGFVAGMFAARRR